MLMELVQRGALLPSYRALRFIDHVVAGLGAIHAAGVTHGDLRPSNIILEAESGRPMIVDFGVHGPANRGRARRPPTVRGSRARSRCCLGGGAPTICRISCTGLHHLRAPDDIGPSATDPTRDLPSADRPGLPPSLDELVLWCLAERPEDRPSTCDEIREALQHVPDRAWEPIASPRPRPSSEPTPQSHPSPSPHPGRRALARGIVTPAP